MSELRRGTWRRRGQAAVEFALVLPFLLVMLVGIIEFGRAWNEHQVITDAAREAARKGAIYDESVTKADIEKVANDALAAAGINPSTATITLDNWDGDAGEKLTVSIDLPYTFTIFGPLVRWSTGQSNIVLKTSFSMRNE
ncbi:MAG TPA: TadE/TadG family type IV pilus assembly protein [Gemmatimonadales bacterium]|nr:TadE/TadG family type IV pilus assembly protein [Gemmatimonadales bacterium]